MTSNIPLTGIENTVVKQGCTEAIDVEAINWENVVAQFTPRKDKALKRDTTEAMHLDGAVPSEVLQTWLHHYRTPATPPGLQYRRQKHAEKVRKAAKMECRAQEYAKARSAIHLPMGMQVTKQSSPLPQILVLLRVHPATHRALLPLLYRRIQVTVSAPALVTSLAANPILPPLVSSLCMEDPAVPVDPVHWAAILPQLTNLKILLVAPSVIPLPHDVIPLIKFHLVAFHAITSMPSSWVNFLATEACSQLESLVLHRKFHGTVPRMRRLSSIKAHPVILASFAAHHAHLTDAWFFTSESLVSVTGHLCAKDLGKFAQSPACLDTIRISTADLLLLIAGAPGFLSTLRRIVLDEDMTWSDFMLKGNDSPTLIQTKNALVNLAVFLDVSFVSLKSLFLVCSETYTDRCHRPLLRRHHARCFSKIMLSYCAAFNLRTFHFSAVDGYVEVNRWGGLDKEWIFIDKDGEWDEVSSRPAVIFGIEDYAYLFP
ncbi:hypothetical protein K438DRAFT_2058165 [Mycena galopus ATCC 62051]|nr:hypothetical protein K438DRAFT_2058165 [Mycena galopus ATCC 62051]